MPATAIEEAVTVRFDVSFPLGGGVIVLLLSENVTPEGVAPNHEHERFTGNMKLLTEVMIIVYDFVCGP